MKNDWSKILLSPLFIIGLCTLLANDFIFKTQFHNFLTGKISDFAGLFIFPLFFVVFFPKRKLIIYVFTLLFFIFWKSPFSENVIDIWNSFNLFQFGRTIDYTDLLALVTLPFSYIYGQNCLSKHIANFKLKPVLTSLVFVISSFAFIATSLADEASINLTDNYEINLTRNEFENLLRQNEKIELTDLQTSNFNAVENTNTKKKKNQFEDFHVYFKLRHKICDTPEPNVSFLVEDKKTKLNLKFVSFRIRCAAFAEPNSKNAREEYVLIVKEIFEKEVLPYLNKPK